MTLAVSIVSRHKMKGARVHLCDVTFSGDHASGGEAITAANCGLTRIDDVRVNQIKGGYVFAWDKANGKLITYIGDYDALADGPLVDFGATTYPAGITDNDPLRIEVIGV